MAYRTGRTRTLTYITTIAADADFWLCNTNPPVDDDHHPLIYGSIHLACSWASATISPNGSSGYITDPHPPGDRTTTGYLDMALTCMGDSASYHLAARSVTVPRGSCDHTPVHMSGTVTIQCDVEEWVDFPIVDWTEAQKGQQKIDPPPYTGVRLTERPKPGGTASIVVSLADGSEFYHPYDHDLRCSKRHRVSLRDRAFYYHRQCSDDMDGKYDVARDRTDRPLHYNQHRRRSVLCER